MGAARPYGRGLSYSELVSKDNDALKDQLKKHKLLGKKGFVVSQKNCTAYVLQLQTLLLEADPTANDLPAGDSGIVGRNIKRKAIGGSKKRKKGTTYYLGYEWTEEEEDDFEVGAWPSNSNSHLAPNHRCNRRSCVTVDSRHHEEHAAFQPHRHAAAALCGEVARRARPPHELAGAREVGAGPGCEACHV